MSQTEQSRTEPGVMVTEEHNTLSQLVLMCKNRGVIYKGLIYQLFFKEN